MAFFCALGGASRTSTEMRGGAREPFSRFTIHRAPDIGDDPPPSFAVQIRPPQVRANSFNRLLGACGVPDAARFRNWCEVGPDMVGVVDQRPIGAARFGVVVQVDDGSVEDGRVNRDG